MHADQYIAELKATHLIKRCRAGFDNEHHWMAFRKKHAKEIAALPLYLRNAVCMAWDNSGPREKLASKASPPSGGPK